MTHSPTLSTKQTVADLYSCGISEERIAKRLDIDAKTLRKYYREELDDNLENMKSALVKNLYQDAMSGNDKAREFWCKTMGGMYYAKPPESDQKSNMETLLEKLVDKL